MHRTEVDIWQARARLGQQLLRWGGLLSLAIGLALIALSDHRFLGGLGTQTALWGLIDAVIAWLGIRSARHCLRRPMLISGTPTAGPSSPSPHPMD